jgi:pimeloyl-ACP methyl ester carboxylesterase
VQIQRNFCSFAAMKDHLFVNGRRLQYDANGLVAGRLPLVLVHGFCEDSSVWDGLLPLLVPAPLVRVDLPGFGGSERALAPGMDAYADAVCAVLNELDIERCVLAGHSMGGYTALAFAEKHPERLAGFSLVHSHPYEDTPERIENRRRGIGMLQAEKKELYVAQLFPGLFAPAFGQQHPDVVQRLIEQGQKQTAGGIADALQAMIDRKDHTHTLRDSPCPVQFVLGEQDSVIPAAQALEAAALPAVADVHLLAGVGHMGMFEAPEQLASALANFRAFCRSRLSGWDSNKKQTTA